MRARESPLPLKDLHNDRDGVSSRELGLPSSLGKAVVLEMLHGKKEPTCAGLLRRGTDVF